MHNDAVTSGASFVLRRVQVHGQIAKDVPANMGLPASKDPRCNLPMKMHLPSG